MSDEAKAIAELSQTGRILFERFSDAVGALLEPWQIERTARAEARADVTRAIGKSLATDIQRRGIQRLVTQSAYEQINIESILSKTVPMLKPAGRPKDIQQDWIMHFIDQSKLISDDEMQSLWASILAGETNAPGRFSKRTINSLASLDKQDAALFLRFCRFNWKMGSIQPLVFDLDADIYKSNGITYGGLSHLETIGLIRFNNLQGFLRNQLGKRQTLEYHEELLVLELPKEDGNELKVGFVVLSNVGEQLAGILNPEQIDGFVIYVTEYYQKQGVKITDSNTTDQPFVVVKQE